MLERHVVDHRKLVGPPLDILNATEGITVVRHQHTNEFGQTFGILEVDARPDGIGPTFIGSESLDSRINDFTEYRGLIQAIVTGSQFIVSEIPGVSGSIDVSKPLEVQGAFQTPEQKRAALKGDFGLIALAQLQGIIAEVGLRPGQDIRIQGASLGASIGADMATLIATDRFETAGIQPHVVGVDLIEPINSFGRYNYVDFARLLYQLTKENKLTDLYLAENTATGLGKVLPFDKVSLENKRIFRTLHNLQMAASYVTAMGIAKSIHSRLEPALVDPSSDLLDADINIWRAAHSRVSDEGEALQLVSAINQAGGRATLNVLHAGEGDRTPLGHNMLLNSMPRIALFMALLARGQTEAAQLILEMTT